jgi:hypothetical protein
VIDCLFSLQVVNITSGKIGFGTLTIGSGTNLSSIKIKFYPNGVELGDYINIYLPPTISWMTV